MKTLKLALMGILKRLMSLKNSKTQPNSEMKKDKVNQLFKNFPR